MNGRIHGLLAGAALAAYAAIGATAFAQTAPVKPAAATPAPHGPRGGGPMMGGWRGGGTPAEEAARLRDLLQLKPAQEPAAQAYAQALDSARQGMFAGMMSQPWPQTTHERLARMQQMMAQHQSAMASVVDATRRFYDQLDPAQKRAFDAAPMMGGGMGMMGGGRWGMMGGRWGGGGFGGGPPGPPPPDAAD